MVWVRNIGLLLILLYLLPAQAAKINKYKGEHGEGAYGDYVPPQLLGQDRAVLNNQGVVIESHKKLKTEEERREQQKKADLEGEETRKRIIADRKKALRDRVLIDTFTTERDILMARDRRIDAVTSQINLTETIIKGDEKNLGALKTRIENIKKSGRKVPVNTTKSLLIASRKLETHYKFVEIKTKERESILQNFDRDIKRFRELKARRKK